MTQHIRKCLNVLASVVLGGGILYWMYRGLDISAIKDVLLHETNWWWMAASFPFGILAQAFRGWRWRQTLEPLGERPRTWTCLNAVFVSYAASLIVPRIGEFTRCGILTRKDGVGFSKALGTVVTERAVDSLIMLAATAAISLTQLPMFISFFSKTGTRLDGLMNILSQFSTTGYIVTLVCAIATLTAAWTMRRRLVFYNKVKCTMLDVRDGIMSLRAVKNIPLFIAYSLAIWLSYFLHFYLTFFCFTDTAHLGISCALVTFIVGSFAVLVPTPNGAGSWHFAVKTMLLLYGVADFPALCFVLVVHSIQTLLVAIMGLCAWICITLTPSLSKENH